MFTEKLKWMYRIARSKSFVILTDGGSVINLPLANPKDITSGLVLTAQAASLAEFERRLSDFRKAHEDAIEVLLHKEGAKPSKRQKKPAPGTTVRKSGGKKTNKL